MQIIEEIEQGSDEWHELRREVITASRFKDVMSKGAGKTRKSYLYQLAAESITGEVAESYTNDAMQWGTETEPQARAMYELESSNTVKEIAFIKHDSKNVGVSPDGLIGDDGLVEIKCPKTTTQIETFLSGKMPSYHKAQVQGQLWISERQWLDFVSFDPRIDGDASYFCVRIERDEEYILELEKACDEFSAELTNTIKKLRG
ncbi:MAG: lambda exonuclease family protein [Candidatus Bathyarchaeia archaeon]